MNIQEFKKILESELSKDNKLIAGRFFGKDIDKRINNNLKWKTTLEKGYGLVIVWVKKFFMELCLNDIKKIDDNLYLENKFVDFNEDNLKKCFVNWFNSEGKLI